MFDTNKTRMIELPCGEKNYDDMFVKPFSYSTSVSRTDGQTELLGPISISRVSVLTRDKNRLGLAVVSSRETMTMTPNHKSLPVFDHTTNKSFIHTLM